MKRIDPIQRAVMSMMARFGCDATLIVEGEPVYDPETSTVASVETRYPIRVMVLDYIKKNDGMGTQTGTLIQAGDKQIMVQATPDAPAPVAKVHSIEARGVRYNLVVVKDYDPSGENPSVYEVFGRA